MFNDADVNNNGYVSKQEFGLEINNID